MHGIRKVPLCACREGRVHGIKTAPLCACREGRVHGIRTAPLLLKLFEICMLGGTCAWLKSACREGRVHGNDDIIRIVTDSGHPYRVGLNLL